MINVLPRCNRWPTTKVPGAVLRRFLLLLLVWLPFSSGAVAAGKTLFYQPQNRDAAISPARWTRTWQQARAEGYTTLVVQWTSYGESTFGGAEGWLADTLTQADAEGLELVVGLHYDPAYPEKMVEGLGLAYHWHRWLSENREWRQKLRSEYRLPVKGWYLPLELDDSLYREPELRRELQAQLASFAVASQLPLHISAFSAGVLTPEVMADWLADLQQLDNVQRIWWQDGAGTGSLAPAVRDAYEDALPCEIGVIGFPAYQRAGRTLCRRTGSI